MINLLEYLEELKETFETSQAEKLVKLMVRFYKDLANTVTKEDFQELTKTVNKLTDAVNQLAEAQKKAEERLTRLETAVAELAEAQKRTEQRVNELAEAQKVTQQEVSRLDRALQKLAEAQRKTEEEVKKLATGLGNLRGEVGGLSRTLSYAFENEAYRKLPEFLKSKYGIEIKEKFIRTEIQDEEINFFAKARRNGEEVYIVGEAKLRLDEGKRDFERTFKEIERKAKAVRAEYGDVETVKMIVTHFAKKAALKIAHEKDILVVQSFEW